MKTLVITLPNDTTCGSKLYQGVPPKTLQRARLQLRGLAMPTARVVSDAPSGVDLLTFNRYVIPLCQILTDPSSETPLTIGILGVWGSGKSTLLNLIDKRLDRATGRNGLDFVRVHFNPWVYREEKNLLIPFLHTLRAHLEASAGHRFSKSAKKVAKVLAEVGANTLLRTVTAGQVSLKDLEEREKKYLAKQRRTESAMRLLRTDMEEAINSATNDGKNGRLVFFVDDLDRCDPFQVLDLLESVKLFLEQRFCFFLLAMDEEVITRGIQIKYNQYEFSEERKAVIGAEYLDKMVQVPVYLYPLAADQIQAYIERLPLLDVIRQQAHSLARTMLPNPRKIKRICNLLALNLAIRDQDKGLQQRIDPAVLAKLIVLHVQDSRLY